MDRRGIGLHEAERYEHLDTEFSSDPTDILDTFPFFALQSWPKVLLNWQVVKKRQS